MSHDSGFEDAGYGWRGAAYRNAAGPSAGKNPGGYGLRVRATCQYGKSLTSKGAEEACGCRRPVEGRATILLSARRPKSHKASRQIFRATSTSPDLPFVRL